MLTDELNRRRRTVGRQPRDKNIEITDGDREVFLAIERHGELPTPYLNLARSEPLEDSKGKRCTKLYHGYCEHPDHRKKRDHFPKDERGNPVYAHTCAPVAYLSRNPRQYVNYQEPGALPRWMMQPVLYGITDRARAEIRRNRYFLRGSNSYFHDVFRACFTFSFEKQARRFRFRDDIVDDPRCPDRTRGEDAPFYFAAGSEKLFFDDLFGNEYEPGHSRFFALEIDLATETMRDTVPNSIVAKIKAYNEAFRTADYKRFGIPNISVLFATTKPGRAKNFIQAVRETVDPKYQSRFLARAFPEFDRPVEVPTKLLPVFEPWLSVNGTEDISKKALS